MNYSDLHVTLYNHDCRSMPELADESIQCVVTSPPYWGLRKYAGEQDLVWGGQPDCVHEWIDSSIPKSGGVGDYEVGRVGNAQARTASHEAKQSDTCSLCGAWHGAFGLEPTPELYVQHTIEILREIRRVLRKDGVVFWNIGDSYWGSGQGKGSNHGKAVFSDDDIKVPDWKSGSLKPKDLCLIPFRVAIAAQDAGWWVRSDIIWNKSNPMPESVHGSYFTRHYVTMKEYEKLQSLRATEGNNKDRACHVPGVQAGEISHCQTPLSTEREGENNSEKTGGKGGCEGETAPVQSFLAGTEKQGEIRCNRKGTINKKKSNREISCQAGIEAKVSGETSKNKTQPDTNSAKEGSPTSLRQNTEGESTETKGLCTEKKCLSSNGNSDGGGLAGNSEAAQEPMPLLPQEESIDNRPYNPDKQGREACQIEHSPGLSELQFQEERQPNSALIECPGCPKCSPHNGYILIQGAGRPTESHEHILMLTKSAKYYWDQEAVRESQTGNSHPRGDELCNADYQEARGSYKGFKSPETILPAGRNLRSVWSAIDPYYFWKFLNQELGEAQLDNLVKRYSEIDSQLKNVWSFPTQPYKKCHFATFPEELPERCIKAATPEAGCCSKCGRPWERIIERTGHVNKRELAHAPNNCPTKTDSTGWAPLTRATDKWQPACKCDAPAIPSTVLDCFAGSGTTLWVAKRLNRRAVGYEISEEYSRLIIDRNKQQVMV